MKKIYLLLLAILAFPFLGVTQKHDNVWLWGFANEAFAQPYFGGANMDFKTTLPTIYPQRKNIDFGFYNGVCSDSSGHLAFYSNGISIQDTTHHVMLHGDTINPGSIWLEWQDDSYPNGPFCFALPAPGMQNCYYFFHLATAITNNVISAPFYYSVINMNGNNGLGEVILKNQVLLPQGKDYIDPVAVKHGNGRDWWIIIGEVQKPLLYTFLLDHEGIHGPFTTMMPYIFPGLDYQSINDISPDGSTYVRGAGTLGLYVFDFDRCRGDFSNLRVIPFEENSFFCFATVFAPNSRHLYISSWDAVTVIDLTAPDIIGSLDTLAYFDGNASPQEPFTTGFFIPNLGPDGKIYYATTNGTLAMHLIHYPDLPGIASDIQQHGLDLPKYNSGSMALFPEYQLGEWEGAPCDTLNGQRPDNGFVKSDWRSDGNRNQDEYILLPPLFKANSATKKHPEKIPSIPELMLKRLIPFPKPLTSITPEK
jgi:hypothetical protein